MTTVHLVGVSSKEWDSAQTVAHSVNVTRHLVNLPANDLTPDSYEFLVRKLWGQSSGLSIKVFKGQDLNKYQLSLLEAVGRGAEWEPRLIKLSYRPARSSKKAQKPLVFVGKGITFDTGGLDLKPASFMRLMKKDMGGSATVVGVAYWLKKTGCSYPVDFYLAIAENSVGQKSYRPGDIIKARNGKSIEIHNTDAEGRLVLADALMMATDPKQQKTLPRCLIDVATLTGAMRVALGTQIVGFFSNNERWTAKLLSSAHKMHEAFWRLPLYAEYRRQLSSSCADFMNASASRYGGAITAALFLKEFILADIPWVHLDLFAWSEEPRGWLAEVGASGHAVQTLIQLLKSSS